MKKKKKKLISGAGKQITATISVALVLLILGIVGSMAIAARQFTDNIRERIGFTLILNEDVVESQVNQLKQTFTDADYVSSYGYLSAEDILRDEEQYVDFDIEEILGVNPYQPEFSVTVKAPWANSDSIMAITHHLESLPGVNHSVAQTEMVDDINSNIHAIELVLGAVALALLVVSFVLINNTVRLTIFSRRFLLHSMQLVGATESFIRRPIILRNVVNGLIAGVIAIILMLGIFLLVNSDPRAYKELSEVMRLQETLLIVGGMLLAGMLICGTAAYFATNRYLHCDYDDLF